MKGEQLYKLVEQVLMENEDARNDDRYLIFSILKLCDVPTLGDKILLDKETLGNMPSFESIRRIRQKIQNEEKRFVPTWANVLIKRSFTENEVRALFGDFSPTYQNYIFIKTEGARIRPSA